MKFSFAVGIFCVLDTELELEELLTVSAKTFHITGMYSLSWIV